MTLTDLPSVVELKREFQRLDAEVEALKPWAHCSPLAQTKLEQCNTRKSEIAWTIFATQTERNGDSCCGH